jgi:hypothetical protein
MWNAQWTMLFPRSTSYARMVVAFIPQKPSTHGMVGERSHVASATIEFSRRLGDAGKFASRPSQEWHSTGAAD